MAIPLRVLLVEDSEADARTLARELAKAGYAPATERVETLATLAGALDRRPWDVVLADYLLPQLNGLEALAIVRSRRQDIPFILVSGVIGEEVAIRSLKAGASDYLLKSNLSRLAPTVRRCLEEVDLRRQRRKAEAAFRESREQLRLIIDAVPAFIAYVDKEKRYVFNNRLYEEWYGLPLAEISGKHLREVVGPAAYEAVRPHIEEALAGRRVSYEAEVPFQHGPRWIHAEYVPHRAAGGEVEGFVALVTDVTDRIRSEEARRFLIEATSLLASSLDYETTLANVARLAVPRIADWCVVHVREEDGHLRRLALAHADPSKLRRAEAMLERYPPRPGLPQGVYHVLETGTPELVADVPNALLESAAQDPEHLRQLRALHPASYMCVPLRVRDRTFGAISLMSSESGRRFTPMDLGLAEELARRAAIAVDNALHFRDAQKAIAARDEFLSIASHELKTPLTSLQLALDGVLRLARKTPPAEQPGGLVLELAEGAKRQARQIAKLINELLDVARIRAGRLNLEREPVDLAGIARQVVERFRGELAQKGCPVSLRADAPTPGSWDRSRLDQVITNLVSNAMKYGAGRPIEISVEPLAANARFTISDHGIGIPPENMDRIFNPFERAVTSRHYSGLGLGLFIVRQIVEAHGGWVRVQSTPNAGSTFVVELPYTDPQAPSGGAAEAA